MKLSIRHAHESEHKLVRDSWTRSLDEPRALTIAGSTTHYMRVGADARLVGWAWFDMHRAWVKQTWPTLTILVASAAAREDEAIGWLAYTPAGEHPLVVHYVYTIDLARKRGVASELLRAALMQHDGRPVRFSHMTSTGHRMVTDALSVARATPMRSEVAMG